MIRYCRHIRLSGGRCRANAIEGYDFCFYHYSQRKQSESIELPPLEDRFAIPLAVSRVLNALISGAIDKRIAGLCLYGIQIAAGSLPKDTHTLDPGQIEDTIDRVVLTQEGQEVAIPHTLYEPHDTEGHAFGCECRYCVERQSDSPHHPDCRCGICHYFTVKKEDPPAQLIPEAEIEKIVIPTGTISDCHSERSVQSTRSRRTCSSLSSLTRIEGYEIALTKLMKEIAKSDSPLAAEAKTWVPHVRGAKGGANVGGSQDDQTLQPATHNTIDSKSLLQHSRKIKRRSH